MSSHIKCILSLILTELSDIGCIREIKYSSATQPCCQFRLVAKPIVQYKNLVLAKEDNFHISLLTNHYKKETSVKMLRRHFKMQSRSVIVCIIFAFVCIQDIYSGKRETLM